MKLVGMKKVDKVFEIINKSKNIVILSHEDPDGDAVGSSLALYNYLKEYFLYKKIIKPIKLILKNAPSRFKDLKGFDEIEEEINDEVDLLIVLDLNDKRRLGEFNYIIEEANKILIIDHHVGEPNFGDYKILDDNSASTSLILYNIFNKIRYEYDLPTPSRDIVKNILAAVISDTSGFKNANTNKEVFEFVAKAMAYNINISDMFFEILGNRSKNELALESLVLNRLEYYFENKIAISYLLLSDNVYANRAHGEHEGLSELLRDIQDVKIGILIRETCEGFKISLRSKKEIDCRKIAETFGGGGHPNASGITIKLKNLHEIKTNIIKRTTEVIEEEKK